MSDIFNGTVFISKVDSDYIIDDKVRCGWHWRLTVKGDDFTFYFRPSWTIAQIVEWVEVNLGYDTEIFQTKRIK